MLIVAFDAEVTRLIQLYILGVFLSFTLSQAGMVRHWARADARARRDRGALRRKQALNGLGAAVTGLVFVIVLVTKFAEGAWIVVLAAPVLFAAMKAIARHYAQARAGAGAPGGRRRAPARSTRVVLVSHLSPRPCVRSPSPRRPRRHAACGEGPSDAADDALAAEWERAWRPDAAGGPGVALPRDGAAGAPLRPRPPARPPGRRDRGRDPRVRRRALVGAPAAQPDRLRLKARLLYEPSVTVTSVPWLLGRDDR